MRNEDQTTAEMENEPVSKLLAGLSRVEAPKDFDFRVKARIARGRPAEPRGMWLPAWVRIAVPAGVLIAGSYFGFNAFYPVQQDQATASMGVMNPAPIEPVTQKLPEQSDVQTNVAMAQVEPERAEVKPDTDAKTDPVPPRKLVANTGDSKKQPGGGSYDQVVRRPDLISGVNLPQIGINTVNSGSAMTVGSVRPGSVADRSGVKAGDVIEKIGTNSLRVRRDGKSITIELKP